MKFRKLVFLFFLLYLCSSKASSNHTAERDPILRQGNNQNIFLLDRPSFFRFTYDNLKMPEKIARMGLLGLNYFAYLTPNIYAGIGAYGAVTGSQGGLFTFGFAAGLRKEFAEHWSADLGLFVGGGGGSSALVGGGLMIRPHIGLSYAFPGFRLGVFYSYINFPIHSKIHSQQIGVNLDIPFDFYYLCPADLHSDCSFEKNNFLLNDGYLDFGRNDFGIILQAYQQKKGTLNVNKDLQDGMMVLVGAEFDHYFSDFGFWWLKASGAFKGIPHGYMDVIGGIGYHLPLSHTLSLIPQIGIGPGGGGFVDTGGGILVHPEVGLEWAFSPRFAARLSTGYIKSVKGSLKALTTTSELIYHLNLAKSSSAPIDKSFICTATEEWKISFFNQIYLHPQRTYSSITSPDYLVGIQFDQYFSPFFFFSYQAASAYDGVRAGGLATGMIGPGIQTPEFFHHSMTLFAELLVGAGGGGGLRLGNGALIEPMIGMHYAITPSIGVQTSVSEIKALNGSLSTPAFNLGLTIRFGTLTSLG